MRHEERERAQDMDDLELLLRAILTVWNAHGRHRRPANRDALVVMLLAELPYDRQRLEHVLMRYGADLLATFRAAREAVAISDALKVSS